MAILYYLVTASKRGAENVTHTYCKTSSSFVDDATGADTHLTEAEANTQYAAQAADGSPYSIVCKISFDDRLGTEVVEQKTS